MAHVNYVVPGLFGSGLAAPGALGLSSALWADPTRLMLGGAYEMRLDAAGVGPGAPDGRPCTPLFPLTAFYGAMAAYLGADAVSTGSGLVLWGYDWRLDVQALGEALAASIRFACTATTRARLACHSLGGVVARLAWASLAGTGQTGLVERIVTLGTPHLGSYSWPLAVGDRDPTLQGLASLQAALHAGWYLSGAPFAPAPYSYPQLVALAATWPSLYVTLPPLTGGWQANDPHRAALYDAGNWPAGSGVSQAHLDRVRNVIHPLLAGPTTRPPPDVMTTVASARWPTAIRLDRPAQLGSGDALGVETAGDQVVPYASAALAGYPVWTVGHTHQALAYDPQVLGELVGLLANPGAAPPPALRQHLYLPNLPVGVSPASGAAAGDP